jgi:hypothetical protein
MIKYIEVKLLVVFPGIAVEPFHKLVSHTEIKDSKIWHRASKRSKVWNQILILAPLL